MYQGKNGSTEYSKRNKTVPGKVTTTRTEDGHKQNTKTSLQYKPKGRRTQDDRGRDGGTNFILRIREQETRLILHEHDDDDDDDHHHHISLNYSQNEKYYRRKTHTLNLQKFLFENLSVYKLKWKNCMESDRLQSAIRRMHFVC